MKRLYKTTGFSAFVLALVLLITSCFSEKIVNSSVAAVNSSEQNSYISPDGSLSFDIDSMGHFKLKDNKSGNIFYSIPQDRDKDTISKGMTLTDVKSELIIEYLFREDENTILPTYKNNSYVMCETGGTISVTKITDGFRVVYDFEEIDIKIPVEYKINGSGLDASIDIKGIDEGKIAYLVSVEFLPYFGAAGRDISGYLFVPDGCGAVAEFNQNIKPYRSYSKKVYGNDLSHSDESNTSKGMDIRLPVFGTVFNRNALMGIIAEGDGAAEIMAETGNDSIYYNTINSKMIYRIFAKDNALYQEDGKDYIYTITHNDFGIEKYMVKYFTLSGDEASYSGMALRYKKYLADTYSLKEEKVNTKLSLRAYGCIEEEKNILGFTYNKKLVLTKYSEMQNILENLKDNQVDNIAVQYMGWSGNGYINRALPTTAKPLSALGGKKSLNSLIEYSIDSNIELSLDADLFKFKKGGNGISVRKNGAKAPSGDVAKQYEYSMVTYAKDKTVSPNYLLSPTYFKDNLVKYLNKYDKLGIDSVSLSTYGNILYSDFKVNSGMYRTKALSAIQSMLKSVSEKYETVALNGGNAYVVPFVDRIYEAPISSSGYDIFAYDVPFYQMAVNGYASYTTPPVIQSIDFDTMILKAIETGSDLLFDCVYADSSVLRDTVLSSAYSSSYDIWKEKAINGYKEIEKIRSKTKNGIIVDHNRISDSVYRVTYSNGTKIYVNYNNQPISVDNVTIPSVGYTVTEATK